MNMTNQDKIMQLFEQKIPLRGWDMPTIHYLLSYLSSMDCNNFINKANIGEREGRCISDLVVKRNFYFTHGIGRSGDVTESQPKAIGSSILYKLTNILLSDLMTKIYKIDLKCLLIPVPVGVSLMLCLMTFRLERNFAEYVIWYREDNEVILKAIVNGGFTPIILLSKQILDRQIGGNTALQEKIKQLHAEKINCVISTAYCCLPREPDDIGNISKVCKEYNVPHIIINDHGLQSRNIMKNIEDAHENGKIDVVLHNAGENILVPSGSSLVTSFDENVIGRIAKIYPGRASSNSTIDIFITLMSLGADGYTKFLDDKECIEQYFQELLCKLAEKYKMIITNCSSSATSVALYFAENIDNLSLLKEEILRLVSNLKVSFIMPQEDRIVLDHRFEDWGTHGVACTRPFVVFQLSLYTSKDDIDVLLECLNLYLSKLL